MEEAKRGNVTIHISPAAPVELALILKSRGFSEDSIQEVIDAMNDIIAMFTRPRYPELTMETVAYAIELKKRYTSLTFFDALHASLAITHGLDYIDLDREVKTVVSSEGGANRGA